MHPPARAQAFLREPTRYNAPLDTIQRGLGHADIRTTIIYVHFPTARQHAEIAEYLK